MPGPKLDPRLVRDSWFTLLAKIFRVPIRFRGYFSLICVRSDLGVAFRGHPRRQLNSWR
jgi:hypothetical protein